MAAVFSFRSIVVACLVLQFPATVFGWGAYGHEAVNYETLGKIKDTEIGKCLLKRNLKASVEGAENIPGGAFALAAISPDYFWKTVGQPPKDRALVAKRKINNRTEHSYHFFEGNAFAKRTESDNFIPGSISALPSGSDFTALLPSYQKLLFANADYVKEVDPTKALKDPKNATPRDVADHGTAPWRALQMYRLAVDALKADKMDVALVYLGAMGHYVGDMSQPFHASLDYDGDYPVDYAPGIHALFETDMLNLYAGGPLKEDKRITFWANYDATHQGMSTAAGSDLTPIAEDQIVPQILTMVDSGFAYGPELMEALHSLRENHPALKKPLQKTRAAIGPATPRITDAHKNHTNPEITYDEGVVKEFMNKKVAELNDQSAPTGNQITVVQVAEKRMAKSVGLLSRLVVSAYAEAHRTVSCESLAELDHDAIERLAITNYHAADDEQGHGYLPQDAQPLPPQF